MAAGTALVGRGGAVRGLAKRWLAVATRRTDGSEDLVCSPAGLWLALGAVAAGARRATAAELRDLLGVAGEAAATPVTEVARELRRTGALRVATGVWARVPVLRAYREALPDVVFGGGVDPAAVDAWVAEATDGLVDRLPAPLDSDAPLVVVNALLLAGRWETPFPAAWTEPVVFTDAAGRRRAVATMHRRLPAADAWRVGPGRRAVSVVQLRCRAGGADGLPAVVRLVLGPVGAGPAQVLPAAWAAPARRRAFDAEAVEVAVPRLALRSRLRVLPQLRALGLRLAASDAADFSGMSPEPLAVGQVVQECVLRLAEEGMEAAAVTAVAFRMVSAVGSPRTPRLTFDRPFGVVVLDGSGTVPLMVAWQARAPVGP